MTNRFVRRSAMAVFSPLMVAALADGGTSAIRVSVASSGKQANDISGYAEVSPTGRCVVFDSFASDLIENDSNGARDVFVHDTWTKMTYCVSVSTQGELGNDVSGLAHISLDTDFIGFTSVATNLILDDQNGDNGDVYVRYRVSGTTFLVSITSNGGQGNSASFEPTFSRDRRYVAFASYSTDMTDDDDVNEYESDVFVRDLVAETTTCISLSYEGGRTGNGRSGFEGAPAISADGRYVAFASMATDLVSKSDQDRDKNAIYDIFRRDLQTNETIRVSVSNGGAIGDDGSSSPHISADGNLILFYTQASNFGKGGGQIYLRDVAKKTTECVSIGNSGNAGNHASTPGGMSADGRFIVFFTAATNLVSGDKNGKVDVFVRDRKAKATYLIPYGFDGSQANGHSGWCSLSANGRWVVFESEATNLVEDDTNETWDIFLVDFRGCTDFLRGDSNCDGVVDFADIDHFVAALIDADDYAATHLSCDWQCNNDIDGDGNVDFNDIDGFAKCLINSGCP